MRTRSATRGLHHRALVRVREVDLLRLGVAAEALHLHDLALPGEALLADDRADEDQDDRDPEEDAGEVERRAHEGPDDQEDEDGDCDLHRRGSKSRNRSVPRGQRLAGLARTTRTSDCGRLAVEPLLKLAVAALDVLARLERLLVLVARALDHRPGGGVAREALVVG